MNLIFGAKAIPLFAATGTVGASVAAPHISTYFKTLSSSEELFDSTIKSKATITHASAPVISESLSTKEQTQETQRVTKEAKISGIEKDYLRIKKGIEDNGNCKVELVVSAVSGKTFELSFDDLKNNSEDTIFSSDSSLGMSKFSKFADDLEGRSNDNYSKYLDGLKSRCTSNGTLYFQGRNKVEENGLGNKESNYMVGLQNLWVDESLLSGEKVSSKKVAK